MLELNPLFLFFLAIFSIMLTFFLADYLEFSALSGCKSNYRISPFSAFISLILRCFSSFCMLAFLIHAFTEPVQNSLTSSNIPGGFSVVYGAASSLADTLAADVHANHILWYALPFVGALLCLYWTCRSGLVLSLDDAS